MFTNMVTVGGLHNYCACTKLLYIWYRTATSYYCCLVFLLLKFLSKLHPPFQNLDPPLICKVQWSKRDTGENFRIVKWRKAVKKVLMKCVTCKHYEGKAYPTPMIADLQTELCKVGTTIYIHQS